jgi:hypothetical protein
MLEASGPEADRNRVENVVWRLTQRESGFVCWFGEGCLMMIFLLSLLGDPSLGEEFPL